MDLQTICSHSSWSSFLENHSQSLSRLHTRLLLQCVCFLFYLSPFVVLVCSFVWNAQEEISLPQKYELKNVCNLRVLVGSVAERGGNLTVTLNPHCRWAFTSGEKLEYATKSNNECNSGISKDIWCHKNPCIIIYEYINAFSFLFFFFPFYFYRSLWWSDVCLWECYVECRKYSYFVGQTVSLRLHILFFLHVCRLGLQKHEGQFEDVNRIHTIKEASSCFNISVQKRQCERQTRGNMCMSSLKSFCFRIYQWFLKQQIRKIKSHWNKWQ